MKRFIEHEELARDSRFIRGNNAQATVLASLPDDVDAVVKAIDPMAQLIEEGVRGTAAEPLFEAYGPAFIITVLNEPWIRRHRLLGFDFFSECTESSLANSKPLKEPLDHSGTFPMRLGNSR